ncbi:MAG: porin family protein [Bacteroidota bacterium]|nr:porin family protein [Bacteroidota bacterium]MDP4204766.1 porin family protein [Bacteroidota bacterium]
MMRPFLKGFLFLAFLFCGAAAYCQPRSFLNLSTFDQRPVHFGFLLGVNTLDFDIKSFDNDYRSDVTTLKYGLTVGIISNLRLGDYFDLRFMPGMSFGDRNVKFVLAPDTTYASVKSTYIDLPLLLKYKAMRIKNVRPYIVTGPAYRYDISKSAKDDLLRLQRGEWFWEVGVGLDNYLQYFKFAPELKMSFGLGNVLGTPPPEDSGTSSVYHKSIRKLSSNIVTLSFHFE